METVTESAKGKYDKFQDNLSKLELLFNNNSNNNVKGEYLGFFITRFLNKILDNFVDQTSVYFNSFQFNENDKKILIGCADALSAMIDKTEPLKSSVEIKHIVAKSIDYFNSSCQEKIGINYYIVGILDNSLALINVSSSISNSELTRKSRRLLIVKGILHGLIGSIDMYYN